MYRVALCEDEMIFSKTQEIICCDILEKLKIEYNMSLFDNSKGFLEAFFEKQARYDLILLDIIMDGIDGMELARRVREEDKEAAIIFITSDSGYALQGYDVNALHYLMKPLDGDTLERLITNDYNSRLQNSSFIFDSANGILRVTAKDIICIETLGRKVRVTLTDQNKVYYNGKLTELLAKLPKDMFIRCHQSYALNIANIREFTRQDAIAVNGTTIPVSRAFAKDVQRVFLKQIREL